MVCKAWKEKAALWVLALHSHRTHFSTNISCSFLLQSALHRRSAAFTTCPEERANEKSHLQRRGASKQEKKCRRVQRSCVNEWEKVRVGWPCYQLGWVGQAGRRLLSTGRDRQMLALLPGQNISPGAGSTQSGPGSCNPNDHWWRCTWPTDQSHTQWALPPLPFILLPGLQSPLWPPTPHNSGTEAGSQQKLFVFTAQKKKRYMNKSNNMT